MTAALPHTLHMSHSQPFLLTLLCISSQVGKECLAALQDVTTAVMSQTSVSGCFRCIMPWPHVSPAS